MPPLEAKRLLFRMAAAGEDWGGMLIDVRKAHLNAVCTEVVYVELPSEAVGRGKVGRLKRWLYGMRPAAQAWEEDYSNKFVKIGLTPGRAAKTCFWNSETNMRCVVHGDDFTFMGRRGDLIEVKRQMMEWYDIKDRGMYGFDKPGQVSILNRMIRWSETYIEYEADQKHARVIIEELDMEDAKSVVSPCVKDEEGEEDGEGLDLDELLDAEEGTAFRRLAARANYLAADRADIAYAVKGLCRDMSAPKVSSWRKLKRLARYLVGTKRLVLRYPRQNMQEPVIDVYTDSDWAGCKRTRKSTSGGMCCIGGGLIKSWSKTQSTIAKSSGEAEFYAASQGLVEGLGLRSIAADLGWTLRINLHVDSSAAKAMMSRTGLGKTRHIEVDFLWAQSIIRAGKARIYKIAGEFNPADILTKPKSRAEILRLGRSVNLVLP